jgi:hypothetical protein
MMATEAALRRCLRTQSGRLGSGGYFHLGNVCLWPKTDVLTVAANVRSWGQSGHHDLTASCPLLTQSGLPQFKIAAVQLSLIPHFAGRKSLM